MPPGVPAAPGGERCLSPPAALGFLLLLVQHLPSSWSCPALVLSVNPAFPGRFVHKPFPTGSLGAAGAKSGNQQVLLPRCSVGPQVGKATKGLRGEQAPGLSVVLWEGATRRQGVVSQQGAGMPETTLQSRGLASFSGQWVLKMAEGSREAALMLPTPLHPILLLLPPTLCPEHLS